MREVDTLIPWRFPEMIANRGCRKLGLGIIVHKECIDLLDSTELVTTKNLSISLGFFKPYQACGGAALLF